MFYTSLALGSSLWFGCLVWALTVLGAQIYTSPLLCHILSLFSLFVLGQCSLKLCQSKEVLSISLNDLFPGYLTEVVGASTRSSTLQCIAWAMHASGLLIAVVSPN